MERVGSLIKALVIIVGWAVTATSIISTFYPLPSIISDWRIAAIVGFLIFSGGVLWTVYDLLRNYVWWSNPRVDLIENTEEEVAHFTITQHAYLYFNNRESRPISNCRATLEIGQYRNAPHFLDQDRFRWIGEPANKNCEITVPPHRQVKIDVVTDTLERGRLTFMTCDKTTSAPKGLYPRLRIRVDGDFNGKAMKPQIFDGYLYVEDMAAEWGTTRAITKLVDGKKTSLEKVRDPMPYTLMIFKKGDWMKDKQIPKPKELEEKKPLTKEGFLKVLDKVILTVKPKSPSKGKKGTSA